MSDFLTPLVEAYRAENPPQSLDARALRTRILQASARRHQSPARHLKWLIPLAAAFLGSAALAATPVARPFMTHVWAHVAALVTSGTSPRAPVVHRAPPLAPPALTLAPHPDLPRPSPLAASPALPVPAPSDLPAPARRPETPSVPALAPSVRRTSGANAVSDPAPPGSVAASAGSASPFSERGGELPERREGGGARSSEPISRSEMPAPPPSGPVAPSTPLAPDLSAYQVAHRLHFTNGDYARAFVAWNGYLGRFPHGTFAPEARLNRAVCLARLGRKQEATVELDAIATGRGSYAPQARRLLEALTRRE